MFPLCLFNQMLLWGDTDLICQKTCLNVWKTNLWFMFLFNVMIGSGFYCRILYVRHLNNIRNRGHYMVLYRCTHLHDLCWYPCGKVRFRCLCVWILVSLEELCHHDLTDTVENGIFHNLYLCKKLQDHVNIVELI